MGGISRTRSFVTGQLVFGGTLMIDDDRRRLLTDTVGDGVDAFVVMPSVITDSGCCGDQVGPVVLSQWIKRLESHA